MEIINQQEEEKLPPHDQVHVLIFPYPAQGHVTSMLKLGELLLLSGLHVTILVTDDVNRRLLHHGGVHSRFSRYAPRFRFDTIPDGDFQFKEPGLIRVIGAFAAAAEPVLRERLRGSPTVTCVIADGFLSFAIDVGGEFGIPVMVFRTSSTCNVWAYLCVPKLVEAGELPFKDDNMDTPIKCVLGMGEFLRRRDLPSFIRQGDLDDPGLQLILHESLQSYRSHALIFNTFEELEGPVLCQIRSQGQNVYAIGPLHELLNAKLGSTKSSNSLWKEDRACLTWLDSQPVNSVIYISFGSIATMTKEELLEFWYGLVNSGKKFLWVIRPDSVEEKYTGCQIPNELAVGTEERGYMVSWAPQQEVLAHKAVGGFLTHSGWNSTLESIVAGVPMICWPCFGDQQINSRFVGKVWNLGLDMKDMCDRVMIEEKVRELMDVKREDFLESADQIAKSARKTVVKGGSSYCNLDRLIRDIRSIASQSNTRN